MRILFLHPKSWTGEYAMLRALVRTGHEVCVLEERRGRGKREVAAWHREPGDAIRSLWYDPARGWKRLMTWLPDRVFRRAFEGRNLVHRMWVIREAERHFRPDAMVASDGFSYGLPAGLASRLGWISTRLLVSYIGGDVLDCPDAAYGHRRTPMTDWLIRSSLSGIDVLRPVSPMLRDVLLGDGADGTRIHVLPSHLVAERPALSAILAGRDKYRRAIRDRLCLAPEAPLIVTLSGNQKGKGLHVLAQAWPKVVQAVRGARWLLCGPQPTWLDEAVWPVLRRAGVAESVMATGAIGGLKVFEHLAAADLHVNPSLCEGLNMVTVEAAAVGTPTIGTDGAGVSDWITRHRAGLVVPHGEPEPLADAIIFAFQDRDALRNWSLAAPSMAEEFSLERIAARLAALLKGDNDPTPKEPGARL